MSGIQMAASAGSRPPKSNVLKGFPDNWTVPSTQDIRKDRLDSLRYHAIGNSVTPAVAQWIGDRLVEVLARRQTTSPTCSATTGVAK